MQSEGACVEWGNDDRIFGDTDTLADSREKKEKKRNDVSQVLLCVSSSRPRFLIMIFFLVLIVRVPLPFNNSIWSIQQNAMYNVCFHRA